MQTQEYTNNKSNQVATIKFKGKPKIQCPNCGARICSAGSKVIKNCTHTEVIKDEINYDYIVFCTKCKRQIGIRNILLEKSAS